MVSFAHHWKPELLTKELGEDFMKVTPGIRPQGAAQNDQKRITTPEQAKN